MYPCSNSMLIALANTQEEKREHIALLPDREERKCTCTDNVTVLTMGGGGGGGGGHHSAKGEKP